MKLFVLPYLCCLLLGSVTLAAQTAPATLTAKPRLAITMDDPTTAQTPLMNWQQRNAAMLAALEKHQLKATLFVCGMRVASAEGARLLRSWDSAGHTLANHSWSHWFFPSKKISLDSFQRDMLRCDSLLHAYKNTAPLFRFPYLKEGNTREKRDGMRAFLQQQGYTNGYVSIDASDWYIDQRIADTLRKNPRADLQPYKDYYRAHLLERAAYYDSLATLLTGRKVTHTLLIHHSLLNALCLDEVIQAFKDSGWEVCNSSDAYKDSIFSLQPDILPAGEGTVWAMAKQSGRFNDALRYPAEDGEYEQEKLDAWLRSYPQH